METIFYFVEILLYFDFKTKSLFNCPRSFELRIKGSARFSTYLDMQTIDVRFVLVVI